MDTFTEAEEPPSPASLHQDCADDAIRALLVQEEGGGGGIKESAGNRVSSSQDSNFLDGLPSFGSTAKGEGNEEDAGNTVIDSITSSQVGKFTDGLHSFDSTGTHVLHSLYGTSGAVDGDAGAKDESSAPQSENKDATSAAHTSAAAFVQGGIQDACDDSCSICLEPFCDSDPATVTSCKHEYHLQCILEWAQRSKDCPMCWQSLSFEDHISQELFEAVEQERSATHSLDGIQGYNGIYVPAFANYADFEERIMQHLAHQLARRGALPRRMAMYDEPFVHPATHPLLRPTRAVLEQPVQEAMHAHNQSVDGSSRSSHTSNETGSHEMGRQSLSPGPAEETQQLRTGASDISSLSESLKSRILVASSKWKETLTRTTHGFKERWRARGNSTADFRARAQEVSADVVRHAIKKIAPDSMGKDTHGAASSSTSPSSVIEGEDLVKDNHLEGVGPNVASHQPSSETV